MSDSMLLETLRRRVLDEVRHAVPAGPVALLDFPNYGNPGDSAIWLGALACLKMLGHGTPIYSSDHRTFDERSLRLALHDGGTILLTGGGNFGDLWPGAQRLRERVLREFPDHAVVQLPQTIHFADPRALEQARTGVSAHPDFTILVRDVQSLDIATNELGCRARLCPDLAFCLSAETEPALHARPDEHDVVDVLYLLRTDHESGNTFRVEGSVDWVDDAQTPISRIERRVARRAASHAAPSMLARAFLSRCYPALARQRLRRGVRLLRSGRVTVTDRLHGHVLALLLGIPHVVLGDRNGKVRGFIDAWTAGSPLVQRAASIEEADAMARAAAPCRESC
jgi:pyruvyl transferase EpsO